MSKVIVTGSFDNLSSLQVRFLEEASKLGEVQVLLFSDAFERAFSGREVRFPQAERQYFVQSLRYVNKVSLVDALADKASRALVKQVQAEHPDRWVISPGDADILNPLCTDCGIELSLIHESALQGFPVPDMGAASPHKKVLVSGCYDWLHSGHVRFFEEVSALGDLFVVVGNDENVRFLKGAGHPMFTQDERRYMVQAVRFVKQALVSTGFDWLDYAPQVDEVKPDMFAVNEDGDKPEKRQFCREHGIEYVVLKRTPKEGLPRRESTWLRGF
jgi:cytidyltransferase-like protein